jgi:hypothetical protein
MDATSTIHFYGSTTYLANLASELTSNTYQGMLFSEMAPHNLIEGLAIVNSLTPGYQPEVIFQFAPGPGSVVVGVTIVDKPIIAAHT